MGESSGGLVLAFYHSYYSLSLSDLVVVVAFGERSDGEKEIHSFPEFFFEESEAKKILFLLRPCHSQFPQFFFILLLRKYYEMGVWVKCIFTFCHSFED
jgi:hypothetical protein